MVQRAKMVYLAGPVRRIGREQATLKRRPLERYFVQRGYVTFSPPGAWCGDFSDSGEMAIKWGNDTILHMCDLLVAQYTFGVESVGTDAEVSMAVKGGIPVMVVCSDRDDISEAIKWASPIISTAISGRGTVEFTYMQGFKMISAATIEFEPLKADAEPTL